MPLTTDERNAVMLDYKPWVAKLAKRRKGSPLDVEELIQEGMIGLAKAVETFDPEKATLMCYSVHPINNHMQDGEWRARWVRPGLSYYRSKKKGFKDAVTGWESINEVPGRELDDVDVRMDVRDAMRRLPARERLVLEENFWNNLTVRQIAAKMQVSTVVVHTLKRRALERLRTSLASQAPTPPAPKRALKGTNPEKVTKIRA